MTARSLAWFLILWLMAPAAALADAAPFDLTGPTLSVEVTHGGETLPIAEVPNLAAGDKLWIRADLPKDQSARYLLVAAFLQGATNPPPRAWFHRAETWTDKGRGGLKLVVPAGAQQVIVFLAPQTGGDFDTLVGAVQGRPGAFVRASQDLNQASLDRSRLDAFLAAVRKRDPADPDRLKTVSPLLARSLTIKLNTDCFQKMPELQAACLMQGQEALVLNDGHSTSIVDALTTGETADLAMQLSATPQAGFGFYSPYVAAVLDFAHIMSGLHTAHYQYIPALATAQGDRLTLLLNAPPSFHDPLSVLVAALPAVERPQPPPLQPVDPKEVYCAARTDLVLPMDGAPLAYSTHYAHDMVLRVKDKDGHPVDAPVRADAEKGGFIADTSGLDSKDFGPTLDGTLHGQWGFESFEGPSFRLRTPVGKPWRLAEDEDQSLIVGREDTVRLEGRQSACVEAVSLKRADGEPQAVTWKAAGPDAIKATLPLAAAEPGALTLLVKSYGVKQPDAVPLQAFAKAGRLDRFTLHAGDASGVLEGDRLDEVSSLTLAGVRFEPGALASVHGGDQRVMTAADPAAAAAVKPGQALTAKVRLADGRTVALKVVVAAPRPAVSLIAKSIQPAGAAAPIAIRLTDPDELPQDARLTFSIRARPPTRFTGQETVEVSNADGSALAKLDARDGLTLADPSVAVATLDPAKALGSSVFGPLRFRIVQDGVAGDWIPLATLVRLPVLTAFRCGAAPEGCELSGSNLFLIDSVSGDAAFDHPLKAPEGFPGSVLPAPRPAADGRLYIRLHDDPAVVNLAETPRPPPAPARERARGPERRAKPHGDKLKAGQPGPDRPDANQPDESQPETAQPSTGQPSTGQASLDQAARPPAQPAAPPAA